MFGMLWLLKTTPPTLVCDTVDGALTCCGLPWNASVRQVHVANLYPTCSCRSSQGCFSAEPSDRKGISEFRPEEMHGILLTHLSDAWEMACMFFCSRTIYPANGIIERSIFSVLCSVATFSSPCCRSKTALYLVYLIAA